MSQKTVVLAIGLVLSLLGPECPAASALGPAGDHPVSIVEANIYVTKSKTTMRLKCFAEDLELLQGVEALDSGFYDPDELREAIPDHGKYLAERIELIDANGEKLQPKIVETIDFEIPQEGIRQGSLMDYQMGFVFEFSYDQPPQHLTINQRMIAEGALLPSELKILLKQAGSDTPYTHMMKPEKPETFRFDWDLPPLSSDATPEDWEQWFETQREKNLGIESYSSVYSFIYITHHEVRHEVLIPLATLASLIEIERADESFLTIEEQDQARSRIEDYFSIGNPVEIDSIAVQPVFDRIDFYGLDLRDFAVQAERRKVSMVNGRVGVIMSYSTKGTPRDVKVTWDKFNNMIKSVDSVVFAFEKIEKTEFTMFLEDNTYHWSEPDRPELPTITGVSRDMDISERFESAKLAIPVLSCSLAGLGILALAVRLFLPSFRSGLLAIGLLLAVLSVCTLPVAQVPVDNPFQKPVFRMDDQDAGEVFGQLHRNIFRAFDYHRETDVYDSLAKSVEGGFLRDLYRQVNESLRVQEQGGAVSRIDEVDLVKGNLIDESYDETLVFHEPQFAYRCKWNLVGTIEHWGHIHQRTNQYDAIFNVSLVDDSWKITSMQVLNEEPGPIKTSLRKF